MSEGAAYDPNWWRTEKALTLTHDMPFTLSDGKIVQHPRMSQSAKLSYFENDEFQLVGLTYSSLQFCLLVFLPKVGLDKFIQDLTPENWTEWTHHFSERRGTLQLPRFKLENSHELKSELAAMGMPRAFTRQADFGGISDERLFISWVRQKTFVEVNEEGTEAAALSGLLLSRSAPPRETVPPFTMIVDRPFYGAIRENQTGTILFHGIIEDPRGQSRGVTDCAAAGL